MQSNSAEEWLRLSALYGEMGEIELRDLAHGYDGLTEVAQQVLREEMRKRDLGDPAAPPPPVHSAARPVAPTGPESADGEPEDEFELTWKTQLCECEEREQAWQIREVLTRHGIESWLEGPNSRANWDMGVPRILVAADQLEEAQQILSQPIPRDIVELSQAEAPAFEVPTCPKCGAPDPILEAPEREDDPVNHWSCEACGHAWEESELGTSSETGTAPDQA
jgi:hypothetical protein